MSLGFTDEQQMVSDVVGKFTTDRYDYIKRKNYIDSPIGFSKENWSILAKAGMLMIPISEENGGLGGSAADIISVMQPFGRAAAVEPLLPCAIFAGHFIDRFGSFEQRQKYVPQIIEGVTQIAVAHTERTARFDLGFVTTTYRQKGNDYVLNGHKSFVMGSGAADAFIISAIPENSSSDDKSSIRFFIVSKASDNFSKRDYRLMDGSVASELDLQNTEAELMDARFEDFLESVTLTKVAACAEMVGIMELLFESTVDYTSTRQQFGKALAKFQTIQHRIAEAYSKLELCRSHLIYLSALDRNGTDYYKTVSGVKAYISKAAIELGEEAVQLHGGMGVSDEMIVGHALKRLWILSSLFGDYDTEIRRYF